MPGTAPQMHYRSTDPQNGPKCTVARCKNRCLTSQKYPNGEYSFRSYCRYHKLMREAIKRGFSTVEEYRADQMERGAQKRGFKSRVDYRNSRHRYRKYRGTYCENRDGRLGLLNSRGKVYKCTNRIYTSKQLEVDHINGDHNDDRPENLQTLCVLCHIHKGLVNRDYLRVEVKRKLRRTKGK